MGKIQSASGDAACVVLSTTEVSSFNFFFLIHITWICKIWLSLKVVEVSMKEILPANPDVLEGVDDLIQLSYLNEPSVLYNLRVRYSQDLIYVSLLHRKKKSGFVFDCSSFFLNRVSCFFSYRVKQDQF